MPVITNMKKNSKKGDNNKSKDSKKGDEKNYKKGKDSDSEGGNSNDSENEIDDEEHVENSKEKFNISEYRKMLAEMFPSKYMNNRIMKLEQGALVGGGGGEVAKTSRNSTTNSSNKKSNDADENKKVTRSAAKAASEQAAKSKESKPIEKSKKKGSHNPPPPPQDEDDTSSTSTTCSDSNSDTGDDQYSGGFEEFAKEQLQSGKFNIVINLMNDKKGGDRDEDDSEYDSEEEWESDYDDDEDDDDDDSDYDSDDDDDDDEDEEDDPDYHPDEDEDAVSGDIKGYKYNSKKTKQENSSKDSKTKGSRETSAMLASDSESLETIQKIKAQMEEILKCNKNDSIARETLAIMVKKEKEYKDREEKKVKSQQKKYVKTFKKMLRKKNSTNDLKYFKDNLTTTEQTAVLKELEDLNKLTITDKPYRLSLLQSNIPQAFKAIALKKITNLRYMEPGAGEYYKIKNWVDTFMQIPFGKHCNLPLTISDGIEKCHEFMETAKSTLDGAVYGLNDAKMQIMQMLGQWISNPAAMGTAIAINGPMGTGKCHAFDTSILMYDGSVKMVQDIVVGDKVMGDDSKCRNVVSLGRGEDDMFDIVYSNGEKYGVNSEHIMCLKQSGMNFIKNVKTKSGETRYKVCYFDKNDYKQHSRRFANMEDATKYLDEMKLEHDYIEIPVKTLLKLPKYISTNLKGYKRGAEFSSKTVPFDPYIIGAWLGDGTSKKSEMLLDRKHIPDDYKINDRKTRLELLAGIIDTDGSYCHKSKGYDVIQKIKF